MRARDAGLRDRAYGFFRPWYVPFYFGFLPFRFCFLYFFLLFSSSFPFGPASHLPRTREVEPYIPSGHLSITADTPVEAAMSMGAYPYQSE